MHSGGHTPQQEEFMTCSICEDIFSPPILQCSHGHSYCKQCWLRWIEKQPSCPQCRVPVSTATLVRNIQLESILEHYQKSGLVSQNSPRKSLPNTPPRHVQMKSNGISALLLCGKAVFLLTLVIGIAHALFWSSMYSQCPIDANSPTIDTQPLPLDPSLRPCDPLQDDSPESSTNDSPDCMTADELSTLVDTHRKSGVYVSPLIVMRQVAHYLRILLVIALRSAIEIGRGTLWVAFYALGGFLYAVVALTWYLLQLVYVLLWVGAFILEGSFAGLLFALRILGVTFGFAGTAA